MNSTHHHTSSQRLERSEPSMLPAGQPITNLSTDEANLSTENLGADETSLGVDDQGTDEASLSTENPGADEAGLSTRNLSADEASPSTDKYLSTDNLGADETSPGHAAALRGLLVRVGNTCKKSVTHAMRVRDTTALIRLSDDASGKVGSLIDAGVFNSRGEAAAFFVEEGIKARDSLFHQVSEQLHELDTLRAELRNGAVQPR